ncbi:MAG: energy transducer TonB [Saprospiraceae bacterium]|nr:energy transducer TonB [Saprospiraceae bacterium]
MNNYIKKHAISKIPEKNARSFQSVLIRFTVNEEGAITNAKISGTSGDSQIDNLLLDVINKMPKWNSAVNEEHIKVAQDFEFSIGNAGC